MKRFRTLALAATLVALAVAESPAQTPTRHLTTIDALRRYTQYFHLQNIVLRGEFVETGNRVALRSGENEMQVMFNDGTSRIDGPVEVRAQMIDIGRLTATDPRLSRYENRPDPEHWPMPGEELILSISNVVMAETAATPTIRALALEPWKFEGQSVTVTGQFGGRNLFGDLPQSPAKDKYDFVLRSAEGAIWVTGMRPKGKNFDLNVDARVDTSQWLQVTGAVKRDRGLVLMEAKAMVAATAPAARPVIVDAAPPVPKEPGEIVFSSPINGETNVSATAPIRVQFSRGVDLPSLEGRLRIGYVGGAEPNEAAPAIDLQISYDAGNNAVEIRPSKPLERLRTVKIELVDGAKTFDGAPIKVWSVTFSVGGN